MTSGKEVIARVDNNFDIDYSDWIQRAALWMADAMDEMQLIAAWEDTKTEAIAFDDYIIQLPSDIGQDIKRIQAIEVDGYLLTRLNTINPVKQSSLITSDSSTETYSIKNGYIVSSVLSGSAIIYYQRPAIDYDDQYQLYIPQVPINSVIQNAIVWYLIYCILRKGHKHPTYDLNSNNPITNPYLMWEQEKKRAVNEAGSMDREERESISKIIRTFVVDINSSHSAGFNE